MFFLFKKLKEFQKEKRQKKRLHWFFLVGVLLTLFSGYLLYATPIFTPNAQQILPATDMISFVQIDHSFCKKNTQKTPHLCEKYIQLFSRFSRFSPDEISSFSDISVLAWYHSPLKNKNLVQVKMFRVTNMRAANDFLIQKYGNTTEKRVQKNKIETFFLGEGRGYAFFYKGWLFLTPDNFSSSVLAVSNNEAAAANTLSVFSSFSHTKTFGFINTSQISYLLPLSLRPLTRFFPEVIFSLKASQKNISLTLSSPAKNFSPPQIKKENTAFSLFSALPQDHLIALGAVHDLRSEVEYMLSYFEETDPAFAITLRSRLETFVHDIFGSSISLKNDVLPLAEGESAWALYTAEKGTNSLFVVDTTDATFLQTKREKMLNAAKKVVAQFIPRIVTHVLDDKTTIQEVVACDDCTNTEEETIANASITTVSATNTNGEKQEISLGVDKSLFALSANKSLLLQYFTNRQKGTSAPEIATSFSDAEEQEILLFFPEKAEKLTPTIAQYFADFSIVAASYGQKENRWNLEIKAQIREQ